MRGLRWLFLSGYVVVSALGPSAAKAGGSGTAEGGTITFVGALVEPTCNVSSAGSSAADLLNAEARLAGAQQAYRRSCSGGGSIPADASRTYSSSLVQLSSAESDQVLRYFANYVHAGQASSADAVLMIQTYE